MELIKMIDGGMVDYTDNSSYISGCPTCDYGSEYINDIEITLTKHKIRARTNQMYEHAISEGQMMKVLLCNYNAIQAMTEKEFLVWFKEKLAEEIDERYFYSKDGDILEEYTVIEAM